MESAWLKGALFAGMTADAFKLGTVLTLGWFWARVSGCSVLYRGDSMEAIDFENILAVTDVSSDEISPPSYVQHNSSSTYFYVIRRANMCGLQERSLAAAVKVSVDVDGNLAQPQPNGIFEVRAQQANGNGVQLVWFYCPIEQESRPVRFNIYYDDRTGQINYENTIYSISYSGLKFYKWQSDTLDVGRYLFAIRVEDAAGVENDSLSQMMVQIDITNPSSIDILSTEAA